MRRHHLIGVLNASLIFSTAVAAAQDAGRRSPPVTQAPGGTGMGGMDMSRAVRSEGEIVATLAASDRGEISQGNYARSRAIRAEVREYARSMVSMHTQASARLMDLARRLGIASTECEESRQVTADGAAAQQRLARLRGAAFDRAYMDAQVAAHSRALDVIDRALLPAVSSPEMRTALQGDVRPMVAAHLARARALRERL